MIFFFGGVSMTVLKVLLKYFQAISLRRCPTFLMHDHVDLFVEVFSTPHEGIRPAVPELVQVVFLVAVQPPLDPLLDADAADGYRVDGLTDDR